MSKWMTEQQFIDSCRAIINAGHELNSTADKQFKAILWKRRAVALYTCYLCRKADRE